MVYRAYGYNNYPPINDKIKDAINMATKELRIHQTGGSPIITIANAEPETEMKGDGAVHFYHYWPEKYQHSSNEAYVIVGTMEYGRVTSVDAVRSTPCVAGIPNRVATELMAVYSSLPRAVVIIMNNGGKFTIQAQLVGAPEQMPIQQPPIQQQQQMWTHPQMYAPQPQPALLYHHRPMVLYQAPARQRRQRHPSLQRRTRHRFDDDDYEQTLVDYDDDDDYSDDDEPPRRGGRRADDDRSHLQRRYHKTYRNDDARRRDDDARRRDEEYQSERRGGRDNVRGREKVMDYDKNEPQHANYERQERDEQPVKEAVWKKPLRKIPSSTFNR